MPVAPHSPPRAAPVQEAIAALANRGSLSEQQTSEVFGCVMRGEATPAQIAALLMGLRLKGETAAEVAGAARALRAAMVRVEVEDRHLVDTCGTGGGAVSTFNISTAAAFVAAGAGASVAKHGNRSFTSQCGSADVLEALGVRITLDAAQAARVLREACITFLFAPNFHPAISEGLLTFAGDFVIPIHERAVGIVAPCPDVQLKKCRNAISVRAVNELESLAFEALSPSRTTASVIAAAGFPDDTNRKMAPPLVRSTVISTSGRIIQLPGP